MPRHRGTRNARIVFAVTGLALTVMITVVVVYMSIRITLRGSASEQLEMMDAITPRPTFPPEVLTNGPTPPSDWPVDWRWKYSWVPGCSGRAIVSNRYVDRGGTGGYTRPDYVECSDGTIIADPRLADGRLRTKQGWDQLAYSLCCNVSGCFVDNDPYTDPGKPEDWKCDANHCGKLVWNGKCRAGGYRDQTGTFVPNMCCYDSRPLKRQRP